MLEKGGVRAFARFDWLVEVVLTTSASVGCLFGNLCVRQNARPMTQKARRSLVKVIITNHDVENSIPVVPFTVRNIGLRRETGCESAFGT